MEGQNDGWPLGLPPVNLCVRIMETLHFQSFVIRDGSLFSDSSSSSSSDLDSELQSVLSFAERSTTLGSLIGLCEYRPPRPLHHSQTTSTSHPQVVLVVNPNPIPNPNSNHNHNSNHNSNPNSNPNPNPSLDPSTIPIPNPNSNPNLNHIPNRNPNYIPNCDPNSNHNPNPNLNPSPNQISRLSSNCQRDDQSQSSSFSSCARQIARFSTLMNCAHFSSINADNNNTSSRSLGRLLQEERSSNASSRIRSSLDSEASNACLNIIYEEEERQPPSSYASVVVGSPSARKSSMMPTRHNNNSNNNNNNNSLGLCSTLMCMPATCVQAPRRIRRLGFSKGRRSSSNSDSVASSSMAISTIIATLQ